jgi:hypothetical protein
MSEPLLPKERKNLLVQGVTCRQFRPEAGTRCRQIWLKKWRRGFWSRCDQSWSLRSIMLTNARSVAASAKLLINQPSDSRLCAGRGPQYVAR